MKFKDLSEEKMFLDEYLHALDKEYFLYFKATRK